MQHHKKSSKYVHFKSVFGTHHQKSPLISWEKNPKENKIVIGLHRLATFKRWNEIRSSRALYLKWNSFYSAWHHHQMFPTKVCCYFCDMICCDYSSLEMFRPGVFKSNSPTTITFCMRQFSNSVYNLIYYNGYCLSALLPFFHFIFFW